MPGSSLAFVYYLPAAKGGQHGTGNKLLPLDGRRSLRYRSNHPQGLLPVFTLNPKKNVETRDEKTNNSIRVMETT